MAKAYTFEELMAKNKKIANTPLSELYKPNGDEATEILDIPSLSRDQAAAQASAAAAAQAAKQSEKLYTGWKRNLSTVPAKSYTDWLKAGGMNGQAKKDYDAAVRAAETDYAKTLALYGQNAETLGRAGLTGSGYADYLKGVGFSAMQGAKIAAADTKALTEAQQRMAYAQYLSGVEVQNAELMAQENAKQEALAAEQEATAANIKSTIDTAIQQGMDDKAIMAMIQQHYGNDFDSYLSGWIANAHTYNDPLVAQNAQSAADAEAAKYREEIFNQLKAGVNPAIVRSNIEYVMKFTGADTSQLDTWMTEAQAAAQPTVDALNAEKTKAETEAANARQQQANAAYASLIGGDTRYAPAVAERELKNAGYSDDEILAARTNFQANNFDTGVNNIEMATTADQLADYSSEALELSVQAGVLSGIQAAQLKQQARAKRAELIDKWYKNLSNEDAPDFVNKMHDLYESNDISREDFAKYVTDLVTENITSIADDESVKEPVVEIAAIIDTIENNGDVYGDIEDEVLNAIADTIGMEVNFSQYDSSITFTVGDKKENVGLRYKYMNKEEQQKISDTLGAGTFGEIREYNGKLYQSAGDNTWLKIKGVNSADAGGKDIAPIIYELLLAKYK